MKKTFILAISLFALGTGSLALIPSLRAAVAAKECTDCGCDGPKDGKCPHETGKTCKCPKK